MYNKDVQDFGPVQGRVSPAFEGVKDALARQFSEERQIGASLVVLHDGKPVVNLWGGYADAKKKTPWEEDTRVVLFSVTKGFVAMAFLLLAEQGQLDWEAPVARYWPEFGCNGKEEMSVRTLLEHRGGLSTLSKTFWVSDWWHPTRRAHLVRALEQQKPRWVPGEVQAYHTITYGLYAGELFERITGESVGAFLQREVFGPLQSDVRLGTPAAFDEKFATLYPPPTLARVGRMIRDRFTFPDTADARILENFLLPWSVSRLSLTNPRFRFNRVTPYNTPEVYRHELPWASATGTAMGVARAYAPLAADGSFEGTRIFHPDTAAQPRPRSGWSDFDRTLRKPLGWTCGFIKEEPGVFGPNLEAFGHAGMGGAMGWADPVAKLSIGYTHNRMGWRVRPRRTLELFEAIYRAVESA